MIIINSFKKKRCIATTILIVVVFFSSSVSHAQLAQNLFIGNPKAAALGNAVTADPPGIDSIHFNPAGLARLKGRRYELKFTVADVDAKGKFTESTNPEVVAIKEGFHLDDPIANTESEVESYAVFLPGRGIVEVPFAAAPLGGISFSPPGSNMTFATGVYSTLTLGATRADDDPGRFAGRQMGLTRLTYFSPSIALQVNDSLAVGFSLGFSYFGLGLDLPFRTPNVAIGAISQIQAVGCGFDDNGTDPFLTLIRDVIDLCGGALSPFEELFTLEVSVDDPLTLSYNVGVLWDATPWLTFGLVYQSASLHELEGRVGVRMSPTLNNVLAGVYDSSESNANLLETLGIGRNADGTFDIEKAGSIDIEMPQHLSIGLSVDLTPNIKVNFDVKWTESSVWESWLFVLEEDIAVLKLLELAQINGVTGSSIDIPRGFEDTINWGVGVEYRYSDNLALRLGYEPRKSGIPDDKIDFSIPLGDMDLYGMGFSWKTDKDSTLDFSVMYGKVSEFTPTGSSTNGNNYKGDNIIFNPFAGLDVSTEIGFFVVEVGYNTIY